MFYLCFVFSESGDLFFITDTPATSTYNYSVSIPERIITLDSSAIIVANVEELISQPQELVLRSTGDGNTYLMPNGKIVTLTEHNEVQELINDRENNEIVEEKTNKPLRPCIFCEDLKCFTNLRRHQIRKHSNKIQDLLKLSPQMQNLEFKKIRLEGIYKLNEKNRLKFGKRALLMRSRKPKTDSSVLKMCSECHIFISKETFHRHICVNGSPMKRKIAVDAGAVFTQEIQDKLYLQECISKLSDDAVGSLIKETPLLLYLGERLFLTVSDAKQLQRRKRVNAFLRKLGIIFSYFRKEVSPEIEFVDMFRTNRLDMMIRAITAGIEDGLTQAPMFRNAIKFTCEKLSNKFYIDGDMDRATQLDRYLSCFTDLFKEKFKNIAEELIRKKYQKSKNPDNLPTSEDIKKVLAHCDSTINSISQTTASYGKHYKSIRQSLCTILTLENSRRGKSRILKCTIIDNTLAGCLQGN